jgi:hypothetical protein
MVPEQRGHSHEDSRRAEAALEPVALAKRCLDRMEGVSARCQTLDRGDFPAVGLDGEEQTGSHRLAVEQYRAGATDAVLAAHVGAGEAQLVAKEVAQQEPWFCQAIVLGAVDIDADPNGYGHEIPGSRRGQSWKVRISRGLRGEQVGVPGR